uniref:LAMC1 protein n=1 Tax=Homo sapiens TaxID=9606 RepID=Q96BH6_HUMAN
MNKRRTSHRIWKNKLPEYMRRPKGPVTKLWRSMPAWLS